MKLLTKINNWLHPMTAVISEGASHYYIEELASEGSAWLPLQEGKQTMPFAFYKIKVDYRRKANDAEVSAYQQYIKLLKEIPF